MTFEEAVQKGLTPLISLYGDLICEIRTLAPLIKEVFLCFPGESQYEVSLGLFLVDGDRVACLQLFGKHNAATNEDMSLVADMSLAAGDVTAFVTKCARRRFATNPLGFGRGQYFTPTFSEQMLISAIRRLLPHIRVSGEMSCAACGQLYYQHPYIGGGDHLLCAGAVGHT